MQELEHHVKTLGKVILLREATNAAVEATIKVTCMAHERILDIPMVSKAFFDHSEHDQPGHTCILGEILEPLVEDATNPDKFFRLLVLGVRDKVEEILGVNRQ